MILSGTRSLKSDYYLSWKSDWQYIFSNDPDLKVTPLEIKEINSKNYFAYYLKRKNLKNVELCPFSSLLSFHSFSSFVLFFFVSFFCVHIWLHLILPTVSKEVSRSSSHKRPFQSSSFPSEQARNFLCLLYCQILVVWWKQRKLLFF